MGTFTVTVTVRGRGDYAEVTEVIDDAIVDTGALHSTLPAELLRHLGVSEEWEQPFVLADGSEVTFPVGHVIFGIDGRERPCPAVFGQGRICLLGATTLENFGLGVDPVSHRLIDVRPTVRPF